jgi:hypothetical protein
LRMLIEPESDEGQRVATVFLDRHASPPSSYPAVRVAMTHLAGTYPDNPLRSIGCGRPFRHSVGCEAYLAPDPGEPCMKHLSVSVERGRVVDETGFADCPRDREASEGSP